MPDDAELLRRYAESRSEAAFAELVQRRLDLVYSIALRQVGGDAHLASDVTQRVFTDLAAKASSLSRRPVLSGWLYRSAQFAASDLVRSERRRRVREQEAQAMEELTTDSARDADWQNLRPVIDDAMGELNERDRDAVMLRFFEERPFAEIGATLRMTEDAARMRVERALEKLRALLARRGVSSTTGALGIALANQAAIAAPVGMAASVTGAALAGTVGSGAAAAFGMFFTMSKIKVGIAGALLVAITVPAIVELRANRALKLEVAGLRADTAGLNQLQAENQQLNAALGQLAAMNPETDELLRLRTRAAQLKQRPEGVVDSEMKPAATWKNAGWATPETALETLMWAAAAGNSEVLATHSPWIGGAKAPAEAAFAALNDVIRKKYGTADRLLGEIGFGSRGAADDEAARQRYAGGRIAAYQVLEIAADIKREGVRVRWWEETDKGNGREGSATFCRVGNEYVLGQNRWSEAGWQDIVAQIDPATGELRPRKVVLRDPKTGRPVQK